jgi:hypothetical protein
VETNTTHTLLVWLIVVTAATPLLLIAGGVACFLAWRRMVARVELELRRLDQEWRPMLQRATELLEDAGDVAGRVKHRVAQVDDTVAFLGAANWRVAGFLAGAAGVAVRRVARLLARRRPPRGGAGKAVIENHASSG